MGKTRKRKDSEIMADFCLGTVSGADGAIYRGEDLGQRDWGWGDMLSSVLYLCFEVPNGHPMEHTH